MSTSRTVIRIATLLFLLAGVLLLRKPVFGQTTAQSPAKPARQTVIARPLELVKSSPLEYPLHQI
jgi:hypothetical protein